MFFEIAIHFFDPHSAGVEPQGHLPIGQIGGQAPGLFFANLPVNEQMGWINLLGRQIALTQPNTSPRLIDITSEGLPSATLIEPDACVSFLAQNIEPMPAIQLSQDGHRAKFAVSDQKGGSSNRDQAANISQQGQLFSGTTVSSSVFDPGPGDWDGSFAISQTDDQQLVSKANLRAIHNQTDLSQIAELGFQPLSCNWLVPLPNSDSSVVQQPAQAAGGAQQLGRPGNLASDPAQANRTTLINPDKQPDKVAYLCDPLSRSQFLNPLKPGMIEPVDRRDDPPVCEFCGKNYFNRDFSADQLLFC